VTKMASSSDVSDTGAGTGGGQFLKPMTAAQRKAEREARIAAEDKANEAALDGKMELGRPVLWATMFRYLQDKVEGVTPDEAFALQKAGKAQLLDVRSVNDGASDIEWMNSGFFIAGTMRYGVIPGAVNVPLYQMIQGTSFYKQLRRSTFSYLFGVLNAQELRVEFVKEVEKQFPDKNTPLVIFCDATQPTLEVATGRPLGIQGRSLQAAYYLMRVGGYTNVRFMQEGFMGWYDNEDLPVDEFSDPDAQPFAQRNLPKMLSILFFLVFVTSIKSGLFLIPLVFFSKEGALCDAGFCQVEEIRTLYLHSLDNFFQNAL